MYSKTHDMYSSSFPFECDGVFSCLYLYICSFCIYSIFTYREYLSHILLRR